MPLLEEKRIAWTPTQLIRFVADAAVPFGERSGRCWGLCRYRYVLSLKSHVRIPALESGAKLAVERPHARLSQQMRSLFGPLPLLFFAASFAHHLVYYRLNKPGRSRFAMVIALPVIWDQWPVVHD